jgi:hypothetical protein
MEKHLKVREETLDCGLTWAMMASCPLAHKFNSDSVYHLYPHSYEYLEQG